MALLEAAADNAIGIAGSQDLFPPTPLSAAGEPSSAGLGGPAGLPAPLAHSRHYRTGSLLLDLALQPRDDTSCLEVSGTLIDRDKRCLARVPAYLVDGTEIVDEAMTDARGSFRLATRMRDELRLCLLPGDDCFVELELRRAGRSGWAALPSPRSS